MTRRSTSGLVVKFGQHTVLTASSTQVPIALSSGEAEFYGAVKASSRLIGMGRLLEDLGAEKMKLEVLVDSNAARGVLSRRGTGKIRHLEVQTLWAQKANQDGTLTTRRVAGIDNVADIGTKHLDQAMMRRLVHRMNLKIETTRDQDALWAYV